MNNMRIKTYITKDMREAITRAKYELGVDAMIVSQREVRPGYWFNPFRKTMVEVTFALEEAPLEKVEVKREVKKEVKKELEEEPKEVTVGEASEERLKHESVAMSNRHPDYPSQSEQSRQIDQSVQSDQATPSVQAAPSNQSMQPKLSTSSNQLAQSNHSVQTEQARQASEIHESKEEEKTLSEEALRKAEQDPFYRFSGPDTKERLLGYCKLHNKADNLLSQQERKEFFKIVAGDRLYSEEMDFSKINVLVGPTGVGKTTTIAKLAAIDQLGNKKKVGLITLDTYRIGAVAQLKTYAEILTIPLRVVNSPEEMAEKIESLMHCDRILIDTLGTSPKDLEKLTEIKKSLQAAGQDINTYLVVSMATDQDTMDAIFKRYEMLNYQALLITKLDEVENTKNLWHVMEKGKAPVQYFCYGQNVPEDISRATPEKLFNYFEENAYDDGSGR